MNEFDHQSLRASKEWMTSELARNGYLKTGEVSRVDQKTSRIGSTVVSEFFELAIEYGPGSTGKLPSHCLMKAGKPTMFRIAENEARFYELVAGEEQSPALLESYGTSVDRALQSAVVLIEDKGDDFHTTEWPVPPGIDRCEQAVRTLARAHARWWSSPFVKSEITRRLELSKGAATHQTASMQAFFDRLGDAISGKRRAIIESVAERQPRAVRRRSREGGALTLVHGDAHFWNFLFPRDPSEPPVLIDWQLWGVHFGVADLAYMIGLHWFPERRARYEAQLLAVYRDELQREGIEYSQEDLWHDYRLLVAGLVVLPVRHASAGLPANIWWPHLDRAFSAYDDLDCEEVL